MQCFIKKCVNLSFPQIDELINFSTLIKSRFCYPVKSRCDQNCPHLEISDTNNENAISKIETSLETKNN